MNIPTNVTQNVSNKLRNLEIQDEAKASYITYTSGLYYMHTINGYKKVCEEIYGRLPYLADSSIGDLFRKLKQIMENTETKVQKMISDVRNYLGYNAAMQTVVNGKLTFINPDNIENAWKAVVLNKGIISVENNLYFN